MTPVQAAAREAYQAGLSIVPPAEDGSKRPAPTWPPDALGRVGSWAPFQTTRVTPEAARLWYGPRVGIGVACGAVSDSLECLDFDDRAAYDRFVEACGFAGLAALVRRVEDGYCEDTPKGGVHWLYRCSEIAGNQKLAVRPIGQVVETLIETRGQGGYVVVAPSNSVIHETGRPYVLRSGRFSTIATIEPDERRDLFAVARSLDESVRQVEAYRRGQASGDGRPGDAYAQQTSWASILEPHGWTLAYQRGEEAYWRRPGKAQGVSATTNCRGLDYLIVFSSSTPFETNRGYGKFSAYAKLNHADDYAAAAKALAGNGYAPPQTALAVAAVPPNVPAEDRTPRIQHIREAATALYATFDDGPPKVVSTPFWKLNFLCSGGFAPGELIFLGARPGVGKTAMAIELARFAARRDPVLFVSREMINQAITRRLVAQDSRVNASRLRKRDVEVRDYQPLADSIVRVSALNLYLTDEATSLTHIHWLMENPPAGTEAWKFLIVDYLQLVRAPREVKERRFQVEAVSQGLKAIALKFKLPVLCLTSLRRPLQGNPEPTTADLRESGELEHDADIILLLHKENPEANAVSLRIAKNRDGAIGVQAMIFTSECVSFSEAEPDPARHGAPS